MTTTEHICDLSNCKINNHFFLHISSSGNKLFCSSFFVFIPEVNHFRTDCLIGLHALWHGFFWQQYYHWFGVVSVPQLIRLRLRPACTIRNNLFSARLWPKRIDYVPFGGGNEDPFSKICIWIWCHLLHLCYG